MRVMVAEARAPTVAKIVYKTNTIRKYKTTETKIEYGKWLRKRGCQDNKPTHFRVISAVIKTMKLLLNYITTIGYPCQIHA